MTDFLAPLIYAAPALDTVRIVSADTESGVMIINASDFDAATMTLAPDATKAKK